MIELPYGSYAFITLPNYVTVGKYSSIAPNVHFIEPPTHLCIKNRSVVYTTNWDQPSSEGDKIEIGNDVWIGEGSSFIPPVRIEDGVIIGAYSVVAADVPAYAVVVGNPQRITRYRFTEDQQTTLKKIKWWDWGKKVIEERREDMKNIDLFIQKYG